MDASARIHTQKKSYGYQERNEEKRQIYLETIRTKDPASLVYIDETGIENNEEYPYAWGQRGKRIYSLKNARPSQRLSIISALNQHKLKAPFTFEGTCNRGVFETYVEKVLLTELKPGQTVILDNATFHKGGRIRELIEKAGCQLLYLPPYSPDLNPIEHRWAPLKHHIRLALPHCLRNLFKATQFVFQNILS